MPVALIALTVGCQGSDETDTEDTDANACGDVNTWDLLVHGSVEEGTGASVVGATVTLEDRGWEPVTVLGTGATDGTGSFSLDADGVTDVEGCWGTLLDYVLVATDGSRTGERGVNASLHGAIEDQSYEVDLTGTPIVVD